MDSYILDFEEAEVIEKPHEWLDEEFFSWEMEGNYRGEKFL